MLAPRVWSVPCAGLALLLVGCGGGSTFNLQNPPPPPGAFGSGSSISIAFQPAPPASLFVSGPIPVLTPISASVSNDSNNAGVDWVLSCKALDCGQLTPSHTGSGAPTNYVPPAALFPSTNSQSVTIVASASANPNKNVVASITINAYGSFLQPGTYVFQATGVNPSLSAPFQRVGAMVFDGNGNITSGEQTVNFQGASGNLVSELDPILACAAGGSPCSGYFIGPDGRGSITVVTTDTSLGNNGVETYSLIVLSSTQALITKMDFLYDPQGRSNAESAVGTLQLQTSTAAPTGGYAFATRGIDAAGFASGSLTDGDGLGGILNIDSPNAISGNGSNFDLARNDGTGVITPSSTVSGTVSASDPLGMVQINLTTDFGPIQFAGYIVDSTHIQLIENDDSAGSGFALTAGQAIGQGSATGTFTSLKSLKGSFVFGIQGQDLSNQLNSLAAGGTFHSGGTGTFSGFLDETQLQTNFNDPNFADVQISDGFHGVYSVDPSGSGRIDTDSSMVFSHLKLNGTGPELVLYMTGGNGPALVLDADVETLLVAGGVGTGILYPATAPFTFGASPPQSYGLSLSQNLFGIEADGTGEMSVDSSSNNLSGTLDANSSNNPLLDNPLSDPFQPTTTPGRFTGTLLTPSADIGLAYYIIDSNHGVFVENDANVTGGLAYGYFATRQPVCSGCP